MSKNIDKKILTPILIYVKTIFSLFGDNHNIFSFEVLKFNYDEKDEKRELLNELLLNFQKYHEKKVIFYYIPIYDINEYSQKDSDSVIVDKIFMNALLGENSHYWIEFKGFSYIFTDLDFTTNITNKILFI